MNKFNQILVHPNFSYIYLFLVVICAVSFFVIDEKHPFKTYIFPIVIVLFLLQRYRRYLIQRNQK